MVALVAYDIFEQMKEHRTENWWLGLSYLEIYNGERLACSYQNLLRQPPCLYASVLLTHAFGLVTRRACPRLVGGATAARHRRQSSAHDPSRGRQYFRVCLCLCVFAYMSVRARLMSGVCCLPLSLSVCVCVCVCVWGGGGGDKTVYGPMRSVLCGLLWDASSLLWLASEHVHIVPEGERGCSKRRGPCERSA